MANPTIRWGLMSTARINERMIPCIRKSPRCELLAAASRLETRALNYARKWQIPRAYGTYEQLLADPDIDAVYLSVPNSLHAEWAVKSADAGKHVLCEKPLALSVEEVDQMSDAARRSGVIVQEATMMRFHPQTTYLRTLVANGAIGEMRLVRGVFSFPLRNQNDPRMDPHMGGGSLWDLGTYCVSFARAVLQMEPVEVFANQVASATGVDLSFSAHLRFACGTFVNFFSSFAAFGCVEADLLGSEGRIHLNLPWVNRPGTPAKVEWVRNDGTKETSPFGDGMDHQATVAQVYENTNAYQDEIDSMVASILDGIAPVVSLDDSRKNTATVVALYRSAREGTPVKL
jgi:predicted dehydrogenase